jgi:hypothetical protein
MKSGPRSISVRVTAPFVENEWNAVRAADFFAYPAEFTPPSPDPWVAPTPRYVLDLRSDGQRHRVTWTDLSPMGGAADVQRLRTLFVNLKTLIAALPEVSAMPRTDLWCL